MLKIFVTAIGGDIGNGIVTALREMHEEVYIIGCDVAKYNMSYDIVDEFVVSPYYTDEENWISFILDICNQKAVDYFWPVTEPELLIIKNNQDKFDPRKIVMNHIGVLDIALDKEVTAAFLREHGIRTPRTWNQNDLDYDNFPLIVKARRGCGSHSVKVVYNREQLEEQLQIMNSPIVQQYVGNQDEEYTMTIFSDGKITNYIAFKRQLGFGGLSRYVELIVDEKLSQIAKKIAMIFELKGSINVQMRKQDDDYFIFEINPRISSTVGFRRMIGFNDVEWWVKMMNNEEIEAYESPKSKIHGVRCVTEKLFYE